MGVRYVLVIFVGYIGIFFGIFYMLYFFPFPIPYALKVNLVLLLSVSHIVTLCQERRVEKNKFLINFNLIIP